MDTNSFTGMQASLVAEVTVQRAPVPGRLCPACPLPEGVEFSEACPGLNDQVSRYVHRRIATSEEIRKVEQAFGTEQGILELWRIQRLERMETKAAGIESPRDGNRER